MLSKSKCKEPVYIIKCEDEILFASPDANSAFQASVELSIDQCEHVVEIWIGNKKVGVIETYGEIQVIFKEDKQNEHS